MSVVGGGTFDNNPIYLENGKAHCVWTAPMAAGGPIITASYQGHGYNGVDYGASSGNRPMNVSNQNRPTTTAQVLNPGTTNTYSPINIAVTVRDSFNNLVPRGNVAFSCTTGRFNSNSVAVVAGIANNTWTPGADAGVFSIKGSYSDSNPGGGGIAYASSSDTDNVTVNLTQLPTTTTVKVSPDHPYINGDCFVTVTVMDNQLHRVLGGNVQFSAPSGSFTENPVKLRGSMCTTKWNAPGSTGQVNITATYQQTDAGGYRYLTSNSSGIAHVLADTDATGTTLGYMLEWNTDYKTAPLTNTDDDAIGFATKLSWHDWGGVAFGNDSSWEDDMKRSADGGNENNQMDIYDFTYYSGHGHADFLTFITNHDGKELHDGEARNSWGSKDAEWLAVSACNVLSHDGDWKKTFSGLHLMCGFTVLEPDTATLGKVFAGLLVKDHAYDEPHKISQAWFLAGNMDRLWANQRVLGENQAMHDDYVWGEGDVGADPAVDDPMWSVSVAPGAPNDPFADAGGPYNGTAGQPVGFSGTNSSDPDIGDFMFFAWDMNPNWSSDSGDWDLDGTDDLDDDADVWGCEPLYVFDTPGNYTVRLMVIDDDWGGAQDTAQVNIAAGFAGRSAPPIVGEEEGIEIVDRYPGLPPEVVMPTFKMFTATLGYNEIMNVAHYFGLDGIEAGLDDDLGNWEMAQGPYDMVVNKHSAAEMHVDRERAFSFLNPPTGMPTDAQAVAAAQQFLNANGIQYAGALIDGVCWVNAVVGDANNRLPISTTTFQKLVKLRRTLTVGPTPYPVVGPGGKLSVLIDEMGDAIMYVKIWREVFQYTELPLIGGPQAMGKLHELGPGALISNPGIPDDCGKIYIDNVSVGYYEEGFFTAQSTIYPVYILDMTYEDKVGMQKVQGYMWATSLPIQVTITSPAPDTEVQYGQQTQLTGSAIGGTPPYNYVWTSDAAGQLGIGSNISVTLPGSQREGGAANHAITLTVTDANGFTGRKSTRVKVLPTNLQDTRDLPDDSEVWLLGQVCTAAFSTRYYVEKTDRSGGIGADITPFPNEGDMVSISGKIKTDEGERYITLGEVEIAATGYDVPPVFMANRMLGGGGGGACAPGVYGGVDLYNIGLLATIVGTVTYADSTCFYVDDGCRRDDGSGHVGVKVASGALNEPAEVEFVVVTGISGAELLSGNIIPMLCPRRQSDIRVLYTP